MSILIDEKTRVIVQGITGRDGSFHASMMKQYGTDVVGGVTPGKGGQEVNDLPVFNTVEEAKEVAMEGCAKPYKTELLDGVEVIQAEAIK